jgi:hypothetical protein
MATPSIRIEQAGAPAGVAGESRVDLAEAVEVFFYDDANPGAGTHLWEVFFAEGGTTSLTGASLANMSFTPPVKGSYLVFKTFDGEQSWTDGSPGQRLSEQGGAAILETDGSRTRNALETSQFSVEFLPIVGTIAPETTTDGTIVPEDSIVGTISMESEVE